MKDCNKSLVVLGIRGVPAEHGGFETFAQQLCLFLVERGWNVTVYCQDEGNGVTYVNEWKGIQLIHIQVKNAGPIGTVIFDLRAIIHSLRYNAVFLTLGYNTAFFNLLYRIKGKKNVVNMDGLEWKRQKWGFLARAWFWINERCACWFASQLIADNPRILDHLAARVSHKKIAMIPYGAHEITQANRSTLEELGLEANSYALLVARAEPENSVLELVKAFSAKARKSKLVVLGDYDPESNGYHRAVINAAGENVLFPGAIYDSEKLGALRFFARFYVHGHQVGGTNPSLVEALGAGNAVLAHDNPFNRWVAQDGALYFGNISDADEGFSELFENDMLLNQLKKNTRKNFENKFRWEYILERYEELLTIWLPKEIVE